MKPNRYINIDQTLAINLKSIVLLFVLLQIILQNRLDSFAPSNLDTRCSLQGRAFPYV